MNRKSGKDIVETAPSRASEELYQALFEQAADGIFIADEQGRCIEVNQHGSNMLGYTRQELLGAAMEDLVTAEDLARDPLQLDTMRAGTTLLKQRHFRCKDGRFLPVEVSARMLADGRFLSIVRDVSQRRQVEDQLRESNERFRLLAESSLTGIYLIQDNLFRYVNPAMAHIFGYEVEEIIDKLGPMDLVYADDRSLVAENVRRRIEGEEEAIHYQFRGLCQNGSVIDIEVYGRRIEHEGKTGVIGTLVDITERKLTEETLQRNREAEIQFSEQLAALQEVTTQLSKAESSGALYRQAVQLGRSRLEFDRVSIWFIEERLGIMRGSFGTDERGQLRDERKAQVEFRHEGLAWQVFSQKEPTALVEHNSLRDHLGQEVGEGDSAMAALWDGDEVIGVISVDNLFTRRPIRERQLEILRLYATTLGHLITRKRAEEARRASEARFRTLVDHAADAFFLHDDDEWGTILDVNRQACESLGYSRQELIGMTPHDIDASLDHAYIDQMRARLEAGEVIAADTWHRRKDGSVFPVEVRTRPFWQGERLLAVSLARDVTERRQMEDALKERERHSQSLLRLSRTLEQAQTYDDVLNAAQGEVRSIVGYQNLWAYLFTPDKKQAKILHAKGPMSDRVMSQEGTATITIEGDRMMEEFLETKEIQVIADAQIDERTDKKIAAKLGNRTLVHVPILLFDRLMGSVGMGTFGDEGVLIPSALQREYLMALASHMAVTFDRIYQLDRRKQMEQELIEREHEFRTLAENSPDSIARYDVNCRTLYVNPTLEKTLGRPASEMLGTTPVEAALIGEFKEYQEKIGEVLETGKQAEMDIIMPDSGKGVRYHNIRFVAERRADGTITGVQTIGRDITERKQAETERERLLAQIQEQAQQVQNIIDTVPEGVILLSKDQLVTLTNPVAKQYLTLLRPGWENGRLTHLGQRPLLELLTSPPKGLWHEITSDNLVFEAIARPVENGPENGGWVLVLRDITQERDIQRRVQQQDRLAAVGQLAAGIAHDFNNILAVIALYAEVISRTTEMPARTQEQLHTIEQQIKRAVDLIQQILDFSRQSVLDRQPLDLLPFVEKLVTLLERTLPEHIQIELDHAADAYFIQADPTRMQQVIMNLAVNARDAMPEGGRLHIKLAHVQTKESKTMMVQELPPGNWIQIEVTDSGSGIPPEVLANIFEPFFTTKKEGQGTGLGLAQVYGIVQQHKGYIDVITEVGKGTTFCLYLPALDTGKEAAGTPDRSELQFGQGQTVLLVEDNPATRGAMLDSLILLDYEVVTATNGREALAILAAKADAIDLVLSDVVMPEMGGIALFHAMQEQNLIMPVVLLTGHPLNKEMENLQVLGLAGWLPKPPDLVNMSHLLAKVLTVHDF